MGYKIPGMEGGTAGPDNSTTAAGEAPQGKGKLMTDIGSKTGQQSMATDVST